MHSEDRFARNCHFQKKKQKQSHVDKICVDTYFSLFVLASNTLSNTMPGRSETLDLDSNNLYKLMEEHDPEALQRMVEIADTLQGEQGGSNFLHVANSVSNYISPDRLACL